MSIDVLFNMHKIRFDKMDELINEHVPNIGPGSKVNLFINFESIMHTLVSYDIERYLRMDSNKKAIEMIANIINLLAHYRLYFSKHRIYSKIYLYVGFPFTGAMYKNRSIIPEYRAYYEYKFGSNMNNFSTKYVLEEALNFSKTILEYVNGVNLIFGEHIETSIIPSIIVDEIKEGHVNFLLTKDAYEYQYVNKGFTILRPKKKNMSYMITRSNLIEVVKQENNIKSEINVRPEYITFILSVIGNTYRNIEKLKKIGMSGIIKLIDKNVKAGNLVNGVYNINILSNFVREELKNQLIDNYYCTDIDTQMLLLNYRDRHVVTSQIADRFDNEGLKQINDKFFQDNPINLIELMSGDKFMKKTTNFRW
jgi:hypothetical protein